MNGDYDDAIKVYAVLASAFIAGCVVGFVALCVVWS